MKAGASENIGSEYVRTGRLHQWRSWKDKLAQWVIAIGGVAVILMVILMFFYFIWVVAPLFLPAKSELHTISKEANWATSPASWLAVEEQNEVALHLGRDGQVSFFSLANGELISNITLPQGDVTGIVSVTQTPSDENLVVYVSNGGGVFVAEHVYEFDFSAGVAERKIIPGINFPFGSEPLFQLPSGSLSDLAVSSTDQELVIAGLTGDGSLHVFSASKNTNLLTGEVSLDSSVSTKEIPVELESGQALTAIGISGRHQWLYLGDSAGFVHRLALPDLEPVERTALSHAALTELTMMLGGISVLAGDAEGGVFQAFPVRQSDNSYRLVPIRAFDSMGGSVEVILPETRRKGFAVLDNNHALGFYHGTAGERVLEVSLSHQQPNAIALSPRADGLLMETVDGGFGVLRVENRHPEVSFSSLWKKVWYENYPEPDYVWQSSAATNDFEPKFSLSPLVSGTLKAAFYAMLFAIPLALMGAAYTAYFMTPGLRGVVKPTIEIMEAVPTVILGFLAGLWFAPWIEEHLSGIFMILLVMPPGLLIVAWAWHCYGGRFKAQLPRGTEPLLLIPVLVVLAILAMWLAGPVQALFFNGDLRTWLTQEAGIDYDQRNALVVGCAMGFAVIPTIFSIAEDAIFGVPRSMSNGSLALGATSWQTLVKVVIPTASPGIFSALMIGLGRAVGETMIVLMATGNTPIMDWNIFEGMRTLAANIAVEMPESEVASTHYRVLFLVALVLFSFTFVLNTVAEIFRQRLRNRYSNL